MKKISTFICAGVLMSALCAAFAACNNEPNGTELSDEQRRIELAKLTDDTYYVVGYDSQRAIVLEDGTAKAGAYLFVSENLKDTVYVNNGFWDRDNKVFYGCSDLLDDLFDFPSEIIYKSICGIDIFPKEYRYDYKVNVISYRLMTEEEVTGTHYVCNMMIPGSGILPNKYVIVESVTKVE